MKDRRLGLWSGIGMVVASMIGAGVFVSTGSMINWLNPKQILLAWIIGMIIAISGAKAYSGIVQLVPHSGGEYRFLSCLIHPSLGYLAGWVSLLVGFSAPIAVNALAAGAFAGTLYTDANMLLIASLVIVFFTATHAIGMRMSVTAQNWLVAVKVVLVLGFIITGLLFGNNSWPIWLPLDQAAVQTGATPLKAAAQTDGFPTGYFMLSLFFIAFTFSGWNAAIYAASEFKNPKRDVPRAMILGCFAVGVLYLFINWIFVTNITQEKLSDVIAIATKYYRDGTSYTLGHSIMQDILGDFGAVFMSVLAIIAFLTGVSAMTFLGPRVYAAMARDGFLPAVLKGKEGKPPVGAVILQGAIALLLVHAYNLREMLGNVGAVLTLFSALTIFSLFWTYFKRKEYARPAPLVLAAGAFYLVMSAAMLFVGFSMSRTLVLWVVVCVMAALFAYIITTRRRRKALINKLPHGGSEQ